MTWPMYEALVAICERLAADRSVRVATLRGAGGQAFVAGTDIAQFEHVRVGRRRGGLRAAHRRLHRRHRVAADATVALVEGYAVGGGLAIAAACDFRLATPSSRFGVPIARTLGNCMSMANLARLVAAFGVPRVRNAC